MSSWERKQTQSLSGVWKMYPSWTYISQRIPIKSRNLILISKHGVCWQVFLILSECVEIWVRRKTGHFCYLFAISTNITALVRAQDDMHAGAWRSNASLLLRWELCLSEQLILRDNFYYNFRVHRKWVFHSQTESHLLSKIKGKIAQFQQSQHFRNYHATFPLLSFPFWW